MNRMTRALFISFIIGLWASPVFSAADKPFKYRCADGRKFTITFLKESGEAFPHKARLVFPEDKGAEILTTQRSGSGIRYANGTYEYREHQGKVWLVDFNRPGEGDHFYEIPCFQVK